MSQELTSVPVPAPVQRYLLLAEPLLPCGAKVPYEVIQCASHVLSECPTCQDLHTPGTHRFPVHTQFPGFTLRRHAVERTEQCEDGLHIYMATFISSPMTSQLAMRNHLVVGPSGMLMPYVPPIVEVGDATRRFHEMSRTPAMVGHFGRPASEFKPNCFDVYYMGLV